MDISNFTAKQKFLYEFAKQCEIIQWGSDDEGKVAMVECVRLYDEHIKAHDLELISKITELINR